MSIGNRPLVSVGIPTFDRLKGLRRTLDCITRQTYKNLEIIVSDNCSSSPEVERIVNDLISKDNRIQFFQQSENLGAADNFKFVLEKATGEYFMWASDDDWWELTFIEKALNALESNADAAACWPDLLFHNSEGEMVNVTPHEKYRNPDLSMLGKIDSVLYWHFQYGWYGIYALYRTLRIKSILLSCSRESLTVWGFDGIVVTETLLQGRVLKVPEPLFHYSKRQMDCDQYHLKNSPHFRPLSRIHPYLDQLQTMQAIIWKSTDLNVFEKSLYYSKFFWRLIRGDGPWEKNACRYNPWLFFKELMKEHRIARALHFLVLTSCIGLARTLRIPRRLVSKSKKTICIVVEHIHLHMFLKPVPPNTILIIEPNPFHGETLPGIANYFELLGYNIHVLYSDEISRENPFCRYKSNKIKLFHFSHETICSVLNSKPLNEYRLFVLNSSYDYRMNDIIFDSQNYPFFPQQKLLVVEHNLPNLKKYKSKELVHLGRIAFLNKNTNSKESLTVLNPHYFGIISRLPKIEYKKTVFVTIGTNYRSYAILLHSIKKLIEIGINNFEIVLVGKLTEQINLEKKYNSYLRKTGRVSFEKMYTEVEHAHFLLFLLEKNNSYHSDYLNNNKISGMRQLAMGFLKPTIIQCDFAKAFGFNEGNSLLYQQDDELSDAMLSAAKMNSDIYDKMQRSMSEMAETIRLDSIIGIKRILKLKNTEENL